MTTSPLDLLIRRVGQSRHYEALEAYRACYELGQELVPEIVRRVRAVNWKNLKRRDRLWYLTCLMLLLHDIDESVSKELTDEILNGDRCNPAVVVRLRSIQAFSLQSFERTTHGELSVYVALTIPHRDMVRHYLDMWLSFVPLEDIAGIDRIYVVEKDKLPGLLGNYRMVLAVVSLAWPRFLRLRRLAALRTQFVLYHEIGHHVDRRRGESTESQEIFADEYAKQLFQKAHPILRKTWARVLVLPLLILRKMSKVRLSAEATRPEGGEIE